MRSISSSRRCTHEPFAVAFVSWPPQHPTLYPTRLFPSRDWRHTSLRACGRTRTFVSKYILRHRIPKIALSYWRLLSFCSFILTDSTTAEEVTRDRPHVPAGPFARCWQRAVLCYPLSGSDGCCPQRQRNFAFPPRGVRIAVGLFCFGPCPTLGGLTCRGRRARRRRFFKPLRSCCGRRGRRDWASPAAPPA